MNHANMIEDKYLKKGFIIATVCSTIIGTFTSSIGLWDKVKEKRKQHIRDSTQDEEIKKLRERIEESEKQARERDQKGSRGSRDRDEVSDSFERSSALINREFQLGYDQLGRRFAIGDMATENKLQAQVITLQQTVINVLQDALESGRKLNRADKAKLIAASDAAREGSLDALRQQRKRLAMEAPEEVPRQRQLTQGPLTRSPRSSIDAFESLPRQLTQGLPSRSPKSSIDGFESRPRQLTQGPLIRSPKSSIDGFESRPRQLTQGPLSHSPRSSIDGFESRPRQMAQGPPSRSSRSSSVAVESHQRELAQGPPSRSSKSSVVTVVESDPLYCWYSLDLQYSPQKPLAINFAPRNDCRCPSCGVRVDVEADDRWVIEKRISPPPSPDGYRERRQMRVEFVANARFVIKSHTHHGEFACPLCRKHRDSDMLCPSADTLLDHVGKEHSIGELMKEPDIQEV
ncbi:unnamed protein product [Clonostachys rosea]|uniref:C2H2-type domain-containing protein n=1 Tax=Bionectria ochroleuca TaxID=29856 RepID=A0ABY6UF27_BIOOC|nr:unnamed protein product [Clonostachys rosea]